MRSTCAESTFGWSNSPESASCRSVASGILLQRKYDSRAASSCAFSGRTLSLAGSIRYRKSGDTSAITSTSRRASSKVGKFGRSFR